MREAKGRLSDAFELAYLRVAFLVRFKKLLLRTMSEYFAGEQQGILNDSPLSEFQ